MFSWAFLKLFSLRLSAASTDAGLGGGASSSSQSWWSSSLLTVWKPHVEFSTENNSRDGTVQASCLPLFPGAILDKPSPAPACTKPRTMSTSSGSRGFPHFWAWTDPCLSWAGILEALKLQLLVRKIFTDSDIKNSSVAEFLTLKFWRYCHQTF